MFPFKTFFYDKVSESFTMISMAWHAGNLGPLNLNSSWELSNFRAKHGIKNIMRYLSDSLRSESESHSVVPDSVTPGTVQFMEFSRPEYWTG